MLPAQRGLGGQRHMNAKRGSMGERFAKHAIAFGLLTLLAACACNATTKGLSVTSDPITPSLGEKAPAPVNGEAALNNL